MEDGAQRQPEVISHTKTDNHKLQRDLIIEGRQEIIKFVAKSGMLILVSIVSLIGATLALAYKNYLEPHVARHVVEMITKDDHFEGNKNPLVKYLTKGLVREIGTSGGMYADSAQSSELKVRFSKDGQTTSDSKTRADFTAVVHHGQRVKILILNPRVNILNDEGTEKKEPRNSDDKLDIVIQCDCFKSEERQVKVPNLIDDEDLEQVDITDKIRWQPNKEFRLIKISMTAEPGNASMKYTFTSTVVILVYNSLGEKIIAARSPSEDRSAR